MPYTELITIAGAAAAGAALKFVAAPIKRALLKNRGLDSSETVVERRALPFMMALAGGLIAWRTGLTWRLAYMLAMLADCMLIAVIDVRHRVIPNELIIALIGLTAVSGLLGVIKLDILSSLGGFACCFVLFLLPCLFAKKVGAGDVKLAAAMGFCAGLIGSLYAVALMGGLVLVYTLLEQRLSLAGSLKKLVPMGPFIAIALMVVQAV